MSNLVLSREIYCPIAEVFAYHSDLARAPEYWPNLAQAKRTDGDGPIQPGAAYEWQYNMLGRVFKGHFAVTEVVPNERFTFTADGQIKATFRNQYQATAKTRTRVTVLVEYVVPGLLAKAMNVIFVERRNAADAEHALDQLKEHLESEVMARIDSSVV